MYIIEIKTTLSEWSYGPFASMYHAREWAKINGYNNIEYRIIHLVPIHPSLSGLEK